MGLASLIYFLYTSLASRKIVKRKIYSIKVNNMEKKINPFNYLHSDLQFGEILPHLLSSFPRVLSLSLLKLVCVCVCVCVWRFFPCVRSTYQSLGPVKQASVWNKYMLQGRWWWRQNLCQNTHQNHWEPKPLYTPSKIIQKAFESFNFLHVTLYRILKVNKYIQNTEPGFFCMRSILKMFVETEVICKWDL